MFLGCNTEDAAGRDERVRSGFSGVNEDESSGTVDLFVFSTSFCHHLSAAASGDGSGSILTPEALSQENPIPRHALAAPPGLSGVAVTRPEMDDGKPHNLLRCKPRFIILTKSNITFPPILSVFVTSNLKKSFILSYCSQRPAAESSLSPSRPYPFGQASGT